MSGEDPASRVARYLDRQLRWFEEVIAEADALQATLASEEAPDLAATAEVLVRRDEELATLRQEHDLLLREWQAMRQDADAESRARIQAQARHAEELRAQYAKQCSLVEAALRVRGSAGVAEQQGLERGRRQMRRFKSEQGGGGVDWEA